MVACGDEWQHVDSAVFVVFASWSDECTEYIRSVLELSHELEASGSLLLMVMAEDDEGQPARNEASQQYNGRNAFPGHALWVGDAGTRPNPGAVRASSVVLGYPAAFVVRTRDMVVVTHQGLWDDVLPFLAVVSDLDADWTQPE